MGKKIGFVCDSTADFPPGMIKDLKLHILPVHIIVDDKDYLHGVSIDNREVITRLKQKRDVHTKPFYPVECADFFEDLLQHYDHIVSFHISHHLSGNYRSAMNALDLMFKEDAKRVTVMDLGSVSVSLGLVVKAAVALMAEDDDVSTLAERLKPCIDNTFMGFTVENLTWLKKGGRVGAFAAFVGGMLDIKPIIHLNEAKLIPMEKHRGKKPALKRLVSMAADRCLELKGKCDIWLAYADNLSEVMLTREKLAAAVGRNVDAIKMVEVGATIAVHTGPGSVCIAMTPSGG
ncbi:MAG: DegV family protein [Pseudomonadota bacterium]